MTTVYAVIKFTPGYKDQIVAVYCYAKEAKRFADYENLAHDYSSFSVKEVTPSSITGITCTIEDKSYLIRGVKI